MCDTLDSYELKSLLEDEIELFANVPMPITDVVSCGDSSPIIISSNDSDPSQTDSSLIYNRALKDWTRGPDSGDVLNETILPEVPDHTDGVEMDVESFMTHLNELGSVSTQYMSCPKCVSRYLPHEDHVCIPCPICLELVCICGWPPEICYLCNKVIGSLCTCPFDSQ